MEPLTFHDGRVELYAEDCLAVLKVLPDCFVDAVITDPPYGIGFMGKEWDTPGAFVERKAAKGNTFDHVGGNHNPSNPKDSARTRASENAKFGQWCETWARECLRVLKPGGHLASFSGTRTYHRMACAIEDAGFEIRDQLAWTYGSGFPKSHDVSKGIDKAAGAEREVVGRSPFDARKPNGSAGVNSVGLNAEPGGGFITAPATDAAREWQGWGTALKPAWEPICLARKPLSEGTVAANVLRWGTGAINVDACRIEGEKPNRENTSGAEGMFGLGSRTANGTSNVGRFPANLVHDGSPEVLAGFPDRIGATSNSGMGLGYGGGNRERGLAPGYADSGSAARFFYCAKASKKDRAGSNHPTVKPISLMAWLVRMLTPPGGLVLDPFAGTGTLAAATFQENKRAILIEREELYRSDIVRRVEALAA